MKRLLPLLLALLLLCGCSLQEECFTEKRRINPIPEGTTALIFTPANSRSSVTITDPDDIAALRAAYRWTNEHLHCCLDGEVAAYLSVAVNGSLRSTEPGKIYADPAVPSYNAEFRRLLFALWESAASR